MKPVEQAQMREEVLVSLLARIAATMERQEAVLLALLRQRKPSADACDRIDLEALLPAVWQLKRSAVWHGRDLVQADLIADGQVSKLGMALRELMRTGGRMGNLLLSRVNEDRAGRNWALTEVGGEQTRPSSWHP